jgi:hypothetical protein
VKKALPTHTSLNSFIIQPESYGATVDEGFIVGGPVGDFELLLCHGTVCVVGKMRDLILQLSKKFDLFNKAADLLNVGDKVKKQELEDKHVLFMEDGANSYLKKCLIGLINHNQLSEISSSNCFAAYLSIEIISLVIAC